MKSDEKRQKIKKASLRLFLERGFHQTRIEDIIQEASIGKGTFYLYFKNKEDLVVCFIDEFIEVFEHIHQWVLAGVATATNLKDVFQGEGHKIIHILKENRELASFLIREGRSINKEVNSKINDLFNHLSKSAEKSYREGQKRGLIKDVDPRYAAHCVVGGIFHIYTLWLEGLVQDDVETILINTLDFYLQALIKEPF